MTVLPVRFTWRAPAGAARAPIVPTCVKRPSSTTNAAFSIGAAPSPAINRAPSKSVAGVPGAGDAASSGSSLTIDAPWLLPTQKVTGVVWLSTNTRRTLVERGRRYSTVAPLAGSRRRIRSLYSPPDQTSPFLSAVTSYGQAPGVGIVHS